MHQHTRLRGRELDKCFTGRAKDFVSLAVALVVAGVVLTAAMAATGSPPTSRSAPTIEGQPVVGKTVTAGNGLWNNKPTSFSYRWIRCDAKGSNCAKISGASSKTYTLTKGDLGHTLVLLVTASNAAGASLPTNSKPSDVVTAAAAPTSTAAATITGKPFVGEQLVADPGKYSGGASNRFSFQWRRCDTGGGNCVDIPGATGQTYGVLKADLNHTLRVRVKATNEFGSTTTDSNATTVVKTAAAPPVSVTTSIEASRDTTICCQTLLLSGTVSTHKAGERITILAREADDVISYPTETVTTDASGDWSLTVKPMVLTTYRAQTSTNKSASVTVRVHPRLGLGVAGNNFSAKITARDSFGGTIALFQIQTASGGWKTVQLVVTNLQSVAKFHVNLSRGRTYLVRIYLPQRQAGEGYLDGTSHTRRVGGRS